MAKRKKKQSKTGKDLVSPGVYEIPVSSIRLKDTRLTTAAISMTTLPDRCTRRAYEFVSTSIEIRHDSYIPPSFWLYSHLPKYGGVNYSADILLGKHLLVKYLSSYADVPLLKGVEPHRFPEERTAILWATNLLTSVIQQQIQGLAVKVDPKGVETLIDIEDLFVREPDPDNEMVRDIFGDDNFVVKHYEYCIRIDPKALDFFIGQSKGSKQDDQVILFPLGDIFCEIIHGDEQWSATAPFWSPAHALSSRVDKSSERYLYSSYDPSHVMLAAESFADISTEVVDTWVEYIDRILSGYFHINPESALGRTIDELLNDAELYNNDTGELMVFPDIEYPSYQSTMKNGIELWHVHS